MNSDTKPALPEPWDCIRYDPCAGLFTWVKARGCAKAGALAGSQLGEYWGLRIGGRTVLAHRAAVLYMTGAWPPTDLTVDHVDGNKLNNKWTNLRVVTRTVNNQNQRRAFVGSRSGLLGAHWNRLENKWQSHIRINGKNTYLGRFDTAKDAHAAYVAAKRKFHDGCTI